MTLQSTTYAGLDLTPGLHSFTFAALDENQRILVIGVGESIDVLSYLAGLPRAVVGVNAPPRLNAGRMADERVRATLTPRPEAGRHRDLRVAEYRLIAGGIEVPRTPGRISACPAWMRTGFRFYERLEGELGYQPYPQPEAARLWLEVQADGCYGALLGVPPFAALSLEGRIQRQLALADLKLDVPDAMDFFEEVTRYRLLKGILPTQDIHATGELNALVGAYTAWLAGNDPARLQCVGHPDEALVYLSGPPPKE
jgi:hypothetical protein